MSDFNNTDIVAHQRWLINNGLLNDQLKDNLYLFGAILHVDILHVELDVHVSEKKLDYRLYVSPDLKHDFDKFNKLSKSRTRMSLWRMKRLLKKHGNLDFTSLLTKMVHDLCGPDWTIAAEVKNAVDYTEDYEQDDDTAGSTTINKPTNR